VWIECRVSVDVLAQRAAARARQDARVSDAGAEIAVLQSQEWQPLSEIPIARRIEIGTDRPEQDMLGALRDGLDARLARPSG
jgi:predicted kinase